MAKNLLITGASSGIGAACALHLDAMGFRVFAGVRREEDGLRLKEQASGLLTPLLLDVTISEQIVSVRNCVAALVAQEGLQGLVNNAGIAVASPLELLPIEALRTQFEVNVIGAVAVTQAFLPLLRTGRGRVVNMSSISGRVSFPILGAYAASKFALEALSDALRMELKAQSIPVSLIEPGVIATPIWTRSAKASWDWVSAATPEGRQLYGTLAEAMGQYAQKAPRRALPPDAVAKTVARALTARYPRARYAVGMETRCANMLLRWMPAWLTDRLMLAILRRQR